MSQRLFDVSQDMLAGSPVIDENKYEEDRLQQDAEAMKQMQQVGHSSIRTTTQSVSESNQTIYVISVADLGLLHPLCRGQRVRQGSGP